jgi:hypothetical protein
MREAGGEQRLLLGYFDTKRENSGSVNRWRVRCRADARQSARLRRAFGGVHSAHIVHLDSQTPQDRARVSVDRTFCTGTTVRGRSSPSVVLEVCSRDDPPPARFSISLDRREAPGDSCKLSKVQMAAVYVNYGAALLPVQPYSVSIAVREGRFLGGSQSWRECGRPPAGFGSSVQARLSYTKWTWKDVHFQILRDGAIVLDTEVPPWSQTTGGVGPGGLPSKSVTIRDLDGDGVPEVSLLLYWGGAHCCYWSRIYRYDSATDRYKAALHFWTDFAPVLRDLDHDGTPEFVSADGRFEALPPCYACIAYPVQIWKYQRGTFADVTRRFPSVIKADATKALRRFTEESTDKRGYAAGWAADQALLARPVLDRIGLRNFCRSVIGKPVKRSTDVHLDLRGVGHLRPGNVLRRIKAGWGRTAPARRTR